MDDVQPAGDSCYFIVYWASPSTIKTVITSEFQQLSLPESRSIVFISVSTTDPSNFNTVGGFCMSTNTLEIWINMMLRNSARI